VVSDAAGEVEIEVPRDRESTFEPMSVLVDLKNRGVRDVFFLVCEGLKGLPEVVEEVWPHTIVQNA